MLAAQVTSTEWASAASPVPLSPTEISGLPLLVNARLPLTVPDVPGVNTTGTFTLCPPLRVSGVVIPTVNPEPVTVSCVMETADDPVFVSFTFNVADEFKTCEPKPRLDGVTVTVPDEAVVVGVGVGLGELLAVLLLPPQPIMVKPETTRRRRLAGRFVLLRTVTPKFSGATFCRFCASVFKCAPLTSSFRHLRLKR